MAIQIHFTNPNSTSEMGKTVAEMIIQLAARKLHNE